MEGLSPVLEKNDSAVKIAAVTKKKGPGPRI